MSDWTLIPCLVTLRDEFNRVSPARDKGADGSIGDSAHTSTSDHTPDEDSDVLRDHDADSKNEVHALDIDSSGPWPEPGWFGRTILALVEREKAEYESPTAVGRLQYVIWNHRIASRSWGWGWHAYSGPDPHINHAHASARYLSSTEADTRPWGVEEDNMPTAKEIVDELLGREIVMADNTKRTVRALLAWSDAREVGTRKDILAALAAYNAGDDQAIAELRTKVEALGGLSPEAIAAAIPDELAEQVAQKLADRLAS